MKKNDVEIHAASYYGIGYPAVNVKVYRFPSTDKIADHFKIEESAAEHAAQLAFDSSCADFWESIQDYAIEKLGPCKIYSAGRSDGWLIVEGLPDLESWDAIMLGKWASFEKGVKEDAAYRMSLEQFIDAISANEWHKQGSELYNFVERKDGTTACIADLKAEANEKGFGPVIRK